MELLPSPFLQTAEGNFPSIVTFPAFSLLIIIFVFLTFTLNVLYSNAPLQAFSLAFRPCNTSVTNVKSSAWSGSSGCSDLISLDHASSTYSSQRGIKSHLKKAQPHLKSQYPPEMILLKSHQNFQACLKSNFLFTPISNIYFNKFSR